MTRTTAQRTAGTRVIVSLLALTATLALWLACASGAQASQYTAYMALHGTNSVVPINLETGARGAPIPAGEGPWGIAITPNGQTAYVVDNVGHKVTPIDLLTGTAGEPIAVGEDPNEIAIAPDGRTAYVTDWVANTLTPIDLETNRAQTPIHVNESGGLVNLAITPDGKSAYVVDADTNSVTEVNLETGTPGKTIQVGEDPTGIAITPNGSTAYVSNFKGASVTPIDLETNTAGTPIPVGEQPENVAMAPDGLTAWVASYSGGTLIPIDTQTNTAGTPRSTVFEHPTTLAISPDGSTAVAGGLGGSAAGIVALGGSLAPSSFEVGTNPYQVAILPDQAPVARVSATPAPAGQASSFDASESTPGSSPTVRYAWSFGDGTSEETTAPSVTHVYSTPGTRTVSVTETDAAGTSTTLVYTGQTVSNDGGPAASASTSVDIPALATPAPAPSHHRHKAPKVKVKIAGGHLVLRHGGVVVIPLSCPVSAVGGCHGSVVLFAAGGAAHARRASVSICARGCRRLGGEKYEASAGRTTQVRVHLASYTRLSLRRLRPVAVRLVVTSFGEGVSSSTTLHTRIVAQAARRAHGHSRLAEITPAPVSSARQFSQLH